MTDARTADYARAREAFAALATDEKIGFLLDASFLTAARSFERIGERLSEELGNLADALRGEGPHAAATDDEADEMQENDADDEAADDGGIEPTTERASDEVEQMLDDLFGPDDEAAPPDELPPL